MAQSWHRWPPSAARGSGDWPALCAADCCCSSCCSWRSAFPAASSASPSLGFDQIGQLRVREKCRWLGCEDDGTMPARYSKRTTRRLLTVSGHADSEALLEATLLTAVSVDPDDGAVLHFKTLFILDVLLDAPSEKTLQDPHMRINEAGMHSQKSNGGKRR